MSTADATETIAVITRGQLRDAVNQLYAMGDKLDRFLAGDTEAWTDADTLAGHALLTIVQSHASVTRGLRAAATRADNLVRLDQHRQPLGSPTAP